MFSIRPTRVKGLLASALLSALVPDAARACAFGDCESGLPCSVTFDPAVSGEPELEPFFYSPMERFYVDDRQTAEKLAARNYDEWAAYLKPTVLAAEDLEYLVAKMPLPELDELIFAVKDGKAARSERASRLAAAFKKAPNPKAVPALYYLGFAKRVEPVATSASENEEWREEEKKEPTHTPASVASLVTSAERQAAGASSDRFLTARYRFQILRLHFYAKDYGRVIKDYDKHEAVFDPASSIAGRALDLQAGSYYKTKNFGPANRLYARLVDEYPLLAMPASRQFHPQEEKDWNESLALAKNTREKASLWFQLGFYADSMRAIEKIHEIDPKSRYLSVLVTRVVNRYENESADTLPEPKIRALEKIANDGKTKKPALWFLALAHLRALDNDRDSAEAWLKKAEAARDPDPKIALQTRATRLLARVRAAESVDPALAEFAAKEMLELWPERAASDAESNQPYATLDKDMRAKLAQLYGKKNLWIEATLLEGSRADFLDLEAVEAYSDPVKLEELASRLSKKPSTPLERWLRRPYKATPATLRKLRAQALMAAGRYEEAGREMKGETPTYTASDFSDEGLVSCLDYHTDPGSPEEEGVEEKKKELSRQRPPAELAAEARKGGKNAGRRWLELGNMHCRFSSLSVSERASSPAYSARQHLTRARENYRRAAELLKNAEEAAHATFLAAMVTNDLELVQSKASEGEYERNYRIPASHPDFDLLIQKYAKTQYYADKLEECSYLKSYVEAKNRAPKDKEP
jgi:hypothetical protein